MKNTLIKRIIAITSITACCLGLTVAPATTLSVQAATSTNEAINPCAEILRWVYRETDGKIYKRLLNCTTQQWVGEWIYVGEA